MKWNDQIAQSRIKLFGGLAIALALSFSQSAWAAGTLSGTTINNSATLNFSVGGTPQTAIGSSPTGNSVGTGTPTAFLVDNKVNLTVATVDTVAVPVVPGQVGATTSIVSTFTVTNNGNTPQGYTLATAQLASGTSVFGSVPTPVDNFDTGACTAFVKSSAGAVYVPATDTGTFIATLAPDATVTVYVACTSIPATQVNNDVATINLTATTTAAGIASNLAPALIATAGANTAAVDVVLADPAILAVANNGTTPIQAGNDGKGIANDAFKVVSATLSVLKTVTPICDPVDNFAGAPNGPKNIPGGAVQYAITIANTGAAAASLTTVTDALQAALLFDGKLNSGATAAACLINNATNSLSATGFGGVTGVGATTSYTAPGSVTQAVTAGATAAGQNITINYPALTGGTGLALWPATGSLAAGNFITVYFNAFIQ